MECTRLSTHFTAIEGLPNAGNFSSRFNPALPQYSRMLCWYMGGSGPSCSEMNNFFENVQAVIPRLRPDNFELETAYYKSARQLSTGVRSRSRVPVYCRLTEFLGDFFVVLRDEEGAPKFPNRPSAQTDTAPDAEAPDSAHARRPKRLRRQDGASSSQAQPQPSSSEGVPFWVHDMEQRIVQSVKSELSKLVHKVMTQLESMQVTLDRLRRMALDERARHGLNVNDEDEEGNEQEGNDDDQGDHLSTHTHSTVYNAEDTCLDGDQEVNSDDDTMGWREPRTKKRHERMRTRSRHLRSPFTANDRKKKSTK